MAKFYVTTPIYYVNDKPHVGSAYTTIAADVLSRYHRQAGDDVYFLTGLAEHGQKITQSAEAAGKNPQQFTDDNSALFIQAWQRLGISYDDFIRTTESRHEQAVIKFFEKLKSSGKIYEGKYVGLYCVGHEAFMKESDLDEAGNCPDHGKPPEKVKERNWFFRLSEYADLLKQRIESGEFMIEPESKKKEILSFINHGLEDISISRPNVKWAIPLPWDKTQTIYVWLDELFNYCSAIGYGADEKKFQQYWPADLHLIGKDIIRFHCVIWPALLEAIGEPWPKKVFAHGYFTVDGQKMSKSLGNVVDPVQVAEEYGADVLRYFILRDIPFGNDGDFSHERLRDRYNADLANGLGNLVSRVLNMIEKYTTSFTSEVMATSEVFPVVGEYIESLVFDKALETIWQGIAKADELIERTKPWELAKQAKHPRGVSGADSSGVESVLSQLYSILLNINQALAPFMPATHEKLTKLLQARPLKKPTEPLFARK